MNKKIFLIFFCFPFFCFSQNNFLINSGSILNNVNCGVGEIFVYESNNLASKNDVIYEINREINNNNNTVLIYPNPTLKKIYIQSIIDLSNVYIYDLTGKLILDICPQFNSEIDVSTFKSGTYILMSAENKFNPIKFIKN